MFEEKNIWVQKWVKQCEQHFLLNLRKEVQPHKGFSVAEWKLFCQETENEQIFGYISDPANKMLPYASSNKYLITKDHIDLFFDENEKNKIFVDKNNLVENYADIFPLKYVSEIDDDKKMLLARNTTIPETLNFLYSHYKDNYMITREVRLNPQIPFTLLLEIEWDSKYSYNHPPVDFEANYYEEIVDLQVQYGLGEEYSLEKLQFLMFVIKKDISPVIVKENNYHLLPLNILEELYG